jgi:hypothetical protein
VATEHRRRLLLAAFCLLLAAPAVRGQTVVPVSVGGDASNRLDVVFLGDGYTAAEMGQFAADVNTATAGLLAQAPFDEYRGYLNIRRIEVASADSGVSHPNLGVTKNTAFGAYYNCGGIERLICANMGAVLSVVQGALPASERDLVILLVNDTEYGGSGGTITIASMNSASIELVLHETGHTLGQLADEYGGPPPPACSDTTEPTAANATKETSRAAIKWAAWIDASTAIPTTDPTNGVPGLFAGAMYCDSTLYRPVYNSKMRSLGQAFWQVNVEQIIRRLYAYVDPIDGVSPPTASAIALPTGGSQTFSVSTPAPSTHSLRIAWFLDGVQQASSAEFTLYDRGLSKGSHTVQVVVTDPTAAVRVDSAGVLTSQATWTVTASGPDFTVAADKTSLTLARGQAGTVTLTVTPAGGQFAASVALSCSGLPDKAQCTLVPASIAAGSGTTTVVMTLATTASGLAAPTVRISPPAGRPWLFALLGALLLTAAVRTPRRTRLAAGAAVLCAAALAASCSSSSTPATSGSGTPAGTYPVTVSATSGGTTHTVVVTLTVR